MRRWANENGISWNGIAPRTLVQSGCMESLNGTLRDEGLDEHVFGYRVPASLATVPRERRAARLLAVVGAADIAATTLAMMDPDGATITAFAANGSRNSYS